MPISRAIPFSILDLSPVAQGSSTAQALNNTLDLAQHAEAWGYHRYWLAEHHGMAGVASAATSVVIGHVAGGTSTIRVGSGGIMLPNHSPLVIAEQFGTLASLYPGRIDLGLGRAPGTDPRTAAALRRNLIDASDSFPQDVQELQQYFAGTARIRAVPGEGQDVPIWLLGSSLFSAQLAAALGLPFAFASHFAPNQMFEALTVYRQNFQPSSVLEQPYAMIGVNVFAAETDAEAARLFTTPQQQFLALRFGTPGKLPPPVDSMDGRWSATEKAAVEQALRIAAVGSPDTVRRTLEIIIEETGADEVMATCQMFDHTARLRSFEILAEVRKSLAP